MGESTSADPLRVLVLAAPRDAELTCAFLRDAGYAALACPSPQQMLDDIETSPPGAIVIADELMSPAGIDLLARTLEKQPPWSDLPIIFFCGKRLSSREAERLCDRFNVTVLERPVARSTMMTAVRAALRARRRQFDARALLARVEEANRKLADADKRKDEFLAMLGHELRNPLSAIRMAVGTMQISRSEDVTARARAVIERQSRNLAHLVDDLLDVSRVASGKIKLAVEPIDLREIAQRCILAMEPEARAHQHTLDLSLPAEPIIVEGDAVRLEQILSNLVKNAIKYTPNGGWIEVGLGAEGGEAVLRVRDNGIGISPDLLPHVFDLFIQADRSLARSKGGLGLGLAVVRGLVERHKGTLRAHSAGEGMGSEFVIRLPLCIRDAPKLRGDAGALVKSGSRKIVLVEDNDDARMTTAEYLRTLGHTVLTAADGQEGLELILSARPDAGIVDIGLPRLDGYEVARHVRQQAPSEIDLIALTGYGQPEDRKRALDAGFDQHLVKPIELQALARVLAETKRH
ncbi:ATP-binding protein [Polyangium aurulentum]|uniref:ATP-binding protein n=1 Tax=Polyangium aurulentum TaxID=2567896 RepID=UPI0010ADA6E8|nr:ATP-binding protein [Polyangium aurulentum]UQA54999.1 response regulator [Polyangium aurulentum]